MKLWIGIGLAFTTALAAPALGAANPCTKVSTADNEIDVAEPTTALVTLSDQLTTRLRIRFDADTGDHQELEWDPSLDSTSAKRVKLTKGKWTVVPSIEPSTTQHGTATLVIAARFDPLSSDRGAFELKATYRALSTYAVTAVQPDASQQQKGTAQQQAGVLLPVAFSQMTKLDSWFQPTIRIRCGARLPSIDTLSFGSLAASAGGQRGLGTIPEPLLEVFSLLGEIAIDRAKSGALAILRDRLVSPLCAPSRGVMLASLHLVGPGLALPRTCEMLEQLRLEDVLSSGRPLLRALRDDLRFTIAPAAIVKLAGTSPWARVLEHAVTLVNRAIDQGSFSGLQAQSMLLLLTDVEAWLSTRHLKLGSLAELKTELTTILDKAQYQRFAGCGEKTNVADCVKHLLSSDPDLQRLAVYVPEADRTRFLQLATNWKPQQPTQELAPLLEDALGKKLWKVVPCQGDTAAKCAENLLGKVKSAADLYEVAEKLVGDPARTFNDLVRKKVYAELTKTSEWRHVVSTACHARLAVAIIKTCHQGSCGPDVIQRVLKAPHEHFDEDKALPGSLCWDTGRYITLEDDTLARFRDLVVEGLELISNVRQQSDTERLLTALRLTFGLGRHAAGCPGAAGELAARCARLSDLEDLVSALVKEDPLAALNAATRLAKSFHPKLPEGLAKGAGLLGAVAAYAKVYEETKDADPKAAREARKKALESMMDSATDRHGRDNDYVWSLGSNVGLGVTWSVMRAGDGSFDSDVLRSPQLRVPLGLTWQWLPPKGHCMLGLQLADLGQYVAVGEHGAIDEVRWHNFLSPGLTFGVLIGKKPTAAFNLSVHAEYAPSLFARGTDGSMDDVPRAGAIRFGISFGYYVPFFDFN